MCLTSWILAFVLEALNFWGWGDHKFDLKHHVCMWDRTKALSYTLFLTCVLIGLPCVVMIISYIRIFLKVKEVKMKVKAEITGGKSPKTNTKDWKDTVKSTLTFFLILLAFIVTWGPYAIVNAIDVYDEFSTEVHIFISCLAHMHSCANFIIYSITHQHFRFAFNKVLCMERYSRQVATPPNINPVDVATVNAIALKEEGAISQKHECSEKDDSVDSYVST